MASRGATEIRLPKPSGFVWLVGWIVLLEASQAVAAEKRRGAPVREQDDPWKTDVSLLEEYRLRIASHTLPGAGPLGDPPTANQETDHHLRLLADGRVSGMDDHFLGLGSAAFWWDMDDVPPRWTPNIMASQYDYANPWWALYSLSAEWRNTRALDHFRVGRQTTEHGLPLTFDGASIGLRPSGPRFTLFGFGGRTVHFFETEPGLFENWLVSVGVVARPDETVRLEVDSRLIQERIPSADGVGQVSISNHSYGVMTTVKTGTLIAKAHLRGLDQQFSHAGGAFLIDFARLGLGLDARVNAQLVTLGEVVESENPYFSLLGPSLPHARFRFEGWKTLQLDRQTTLGMHLGWRGRQLLSGEERPFNRNAGALYFQTRIDDLGQRGMFVGGTAEWHYTPGPTSRGSSLAFGGSAGVSGDAVRTEVGTYYQQFKINYYQRAEEIQDARTVYGMISYRVAPWLELKARYEFDIFDRYLQSLFLSMRQDF